MKAVHICFQKTITTAAMFSQSSLPSAWHTERNKMLSEKNKLFLSEKGRMPTAYPVRPNTRTVRTLSNLGICFEGWARNMGEGIELAIKEFVSMRNERP